VFGDLDYYVLALVVVDYVAAAHNSRFVVVVGCGEVAGSYVEVVYVVYLVVLVVFVATCYYCYVVGDSHYYYLDDYCLVGDCY